MPRAYRLLILTALTCAVLIGMTAGDACSQRRLLPGLEAGPHRVGYTIRQEYDGSRTFKRPVNYEGVPASGPIARPLQISIWYPARPDTKASPVKYAEYLAAEQTETDFGTPDPAGVQAAQEQTLRYMAMEWGVERERLDTAVALLTAGIEQPAAAYRDAPWAEGRFPLILHMSGYNSSPSHHAALFEYLASHGYVVAALPSMGMYADHIDNELLSIEVQARDLEFACEFMRDFPGVDPERIGTTGMSWGGMSNVLFGQRNYNVDAVVTLDGAITMPAELDLIESLPGFEARSFCPAYLQLLVEPNDAQFRPKDLRFFEGLVYSEAYSVAFNDVVHDDFACENVRLHNLIESDPARAAYRETFLRTLHRLVLAFFNGYLKSSAAEVELLRSPAEALGAAEGLIESHRYKPAALLPPTQAELREIIRSQGAQRAGVIYRAAVAADSLVDLNLASRTMGPLFMEAFQTDEYEKALEICELWREGNPDQVGPYFSMARIYRQTNRTDEAIECYRRILEITPEGRSADNARRALTELEGE